MGQIVKRKKKGRPSKADLARRAVESASAAEPDVRRSLRRRNVRYNIDYDDYLDEDDEDDEEDQRRREKKLKLVVKLNQGSEPPALPMARGEHATACVSEDECERKPLKKRSISNGRDDDDDDQDEDDDHGGGGDVDCDDDEEEEVCMLYRTDLINALKKKKTAKCVYLFLRERKREYSSAEISEIFL